MPGTILLSHSVHEAIGDAEALAAFPEPPVPCIPIKIEPDRVPLHAMLTADWTDLRRKQEHLFNTRVVTALEQNAQCEVAYFGLAPVPLAIHLGYLTGRWRQSRVFQRNHHDRDWKWRATDLSLHGDMVNGLPQDVVYSDDDVVVRLSVTAKVDSKETAKVVSSVATAIDISVASPGEDNIKSVSDLEAIAAAFKGVLDRLTTHRPKARAIHVFAAVPCGLAYRLGTLISATQHAKIQTYQYIHGAEPKHRRAILLGGPAERTAEPSAEDRKVAHDTRQAWSEDLLKVTAWSRELRDDAQWFSSIRAPSASWTGSWPRLASMPNTLLSNCAIDLDAHAVEGGFSYDQVRQRWIVSDDLILSMRRRPALHTALVRAGRMLFFHEALHATTHNLTEATAPTIRRFPKVLEEVDYQADVWAMMHESAFSRSESPSDFLQIVKTAIETMWAFDDVIGELDRMEIRRINRYLIWYWQYLRLECCKSLEEVSVVLARKPVIELSGPQVYCDGDRVFCDLREPCVCPLELAVLLVDNGIVRHGDSGATQLRSLLEGLRKRDGEQIRMVLKSVFDQHRSREIFRGAGT